MQPKRGNSEELAKLPTAAFGDVPPDLWGRDERQLTSGPAIGNIAVGSRSWPIFACRCFFVRVARNVTETSKFLPAGVSATSGWVMGLSSNSTPNCGPCSLQDLA